MALRQWGAMVLAGLAGISSAAFMLDAVAESRGAPEEYPNPHWSVRQNDCLECHQQIPAAGAPVNLRFGSDINGLCNRCHAVISKEKYIHATGMQAPETMIGRMPESFKKALGGENGRQIDCRTCHEITYQCLKTEFWRQEQNARFHRLAPYESRTQLCYFCHDKGQYNRLNPHVATGVEAGHEQDLCAYCHEEAPAIEALKTVRRYSAAERRQFDDGCLRCHSDEAYAVGCVMSYDDDRHPIYYKKKPKRPETAPANPDSLSDFRDGAVFCGTCHDVHPQSLRGGEAPERSPANHKKLRIRSGEETLCKGCHDAKEVTSMVAQ